MSKLDEERRWCAEEEKSARESAEIEAQKNLIVDLDIFISNHSGCDIIVYGSVLGSVPRYDNLYFGRIIFDGERYTANADYTYREPYEVTKSYSSVSGYDIDETSSGYSVSPKYSTYDEKTIEYKNRTARVTEDMTVKAVRSGCAKKVIELEKEFSAWEEDYFFAKEYQRVPKKALRKKFPVTKARSVIFTLFFLLDIVLLFLYCAAMPCYAQNIPVTAGKGADNITSSWLEIYLFELIFKTSFWNIADIIPVNIDIFMWIIIAALVVNYITIFILATVVGLEKNSSGIKSRNSCLLAFLIIALISFAFTWIIRAAIIGNSIFLVSLFTDILGWIFIIGMNAKFLICIALPILTVRGIIDLVKDPVYITETKDKRIYEQKIKEMIGIGKIAELDNRADLIRSYTVK